MQKPTIVHKQALKLKARFRFDLQKIDNENVIIGYTDSDLAKDVNDRRSTARMAYYLNENLMTWCLQKQQIVELSSCWEEFMDATTITCLYDT